MKRCIIRGAVIWAIVEELKENPALSGRIWDTIHGIRQSRAFDGLVIQYMQ